MEDALFNMLTVDEIKALEVGDWVWIVETENAYPNHTYHGEYCRKIMSNYVDGFCYGWQGHSGHYSYSDYGKLWVAYKNKEEVNHD